jgi:hypothetical protein
MGKGTPRFTITQRIVLALIAVVELTRLDEIREGIAVRREPHHDLSRLRPPL